MGGAGKISDGSRRSLHSRKRVAQPIQLTGVRKSTVAGEWAFVEILVVAEWVCS
jgi:hypothetical protein